MNSYTQYKLVKQETGGFLISTDAEIRAKELAQSCALAFRKNIVIMRQTVTPTDAGERQEAEPVATFIYRKLLHEEQVYEIGT